jgi:hypothetical protein
LGVHHGYNVDNDIIWKDIIDRMKNCIQVWKSRKLSYKGKTIIVKNLLLSFHILKVYRRISQESVHLY